MRFACILYTLIIFLFSDGSPLMSAGSGMVDFVVSFPFALLLPIFDLLLLGQQVRLGGCNNYYPVSFYLTLFISTPPSKPFWHLKMISLTEPLKTSRGHKECVVWKTQLGRVHRWDGTSNWWDRFCMLIVNFTWLFWPSSNKV